MDTKASNIQPGVGAGFFKLSILAAAVLGSASAMSAVNVRVQPSGNDIASAYTVIGENRTYFGNVEGGSGSYTCTWSIDGTPGGAFVPGDPAYISTTHTFVNAGNHFVGLSCTDSAAESDAENIQLTVLAGSTSLSDKNSAIDRGLRYAYLEQNQTTGCFSGSGSDTASTGMALLAMENHGHNLDASDEDLYKKSVEKGLQCLYDNSGTADMSIQSCIGDPEVGDNDTDADGMGIKFGPFEDQYDGPFAILAIVNATDAETAKTIFPMTTVGSPLIDGTNSLFDIIVDAKDYLAWSQTDHTTGHPSGFGSGDGFSGGGEGAFSIYESCSFSDFNGYAEVQGDEQTGELELYSYYYTVGSPPCSDDSGEWTVDIDALNDDNNDDSLLFTGGCEFGNSYSTVYFEPIQLPPDDYSLTYHYTDGTGRNETSCDLVFSVVGDGGGTGTVGSENPDQAIEACHANGNGWRYQANSSSIDNSVNQWPILALMEAKTRWGIETKPEVVATAKDWLDYSQDPTDGSYPYSSIGSWNNFGKTGAGLIMRNYTGSAPGQAVVDNSLAYLGDKYEQTGRCEARDSTSGGCNKGHLYAMYAFYKGMKLFGLDDLDVGGNPNFAWEQDYGDWLVNNQLADGSWNDCCWMDNSFAAYKALAMLAPAVSGLPPVAVIEPVADVNALQSFMLDGTNSFHQDSSKSIATWQWDYDAADGLWWTSSAVPAAGEGGTGSTANHPGYPDTGSDEAYTVTLRVIDNGGTAGNPDPAETDLETTVVNVTSGNVAPNAVTNGPWAGVPNALCNYPTDLTNCNMVQFDGSGSNDPNAGAPLNDSIVSYEWDLDGDGVYNEANGDDGISASADGSIVEKAFATPQSGLASLRVTDSFGLSDTTTGEFVSIAFVYAENYVVCERERLSRTDLREYIAVTFENVGDGEAKNVVMTLTNVPSNRSIVSGVANLGDMAATSAATSSCDGAVPSADIVVDLNRRAAASGSWNWQAEFTFDGTQYIIPNLPGIAP